MTDAEFIARVLDAYRFGDEDIAALAHAIADARLHSMEAAYRQAARVVRVPPTWMPPDATQRRVSAQSTADARGIAETFGKLLASYLAEVLQMKKERSGLPHTAGWRDLFGNMADALSGIVGYVRAFVSDLLPWKSTQITNATCGADINDGMDAFMEDLADGEILDDTGDVMDIEILTAAYAVQVLPETSAGDDICRDICGQVFALSDYDLIPDLPAHPNCPHYKMIMTL